MPGFISRVSWVENISFRRKLWPDYVYAVRGNVKLSILLKGKLTSTEWRPLITSGLIFSGIMGKKVRRALEASLLLVLPALLIPRLAPSVFATIYTLVALALLFSLPLAMVGLLRYTKKLWIRADREAAHLAGTEAFLSSLQKIQSMRIPETDEHRGFVRPTIQERIDRLSGMSSP